MNWRELCRALFGDRHDVTEDDELLRGSAQFDGDLLDVLGTTGHAAIGYAMALRQARAVLDTIATHPGRTIVLLIDTQGQRLRRHDELLGIHRAMAHLGRAIDLARRRGHRVLGLVYDQALSGGFITTGLLADACHALPNAEIRVMRLPAMARVTKLPQELLERLSVANPVFAPGSRTTWRWAGWPRFGRAISLSHSAALLPSCQARTAARRMGLSAAVGGWPPRRCSASSTPRRARAVASPRRRHQLAYLTTPGWVDALRPPMEPDVAVHLQRWAERDLPLVVTKQVPGGARDTIALGWPAPRICAGRRVALRVAAAGIARFDEFPPALDAVDLLPAGARSCIESLLRALVELGTMPRIYGSYGWQRLSGLVYVHDHSDIDLWLGVQDLAQADAAAAILQAGDLGPVRVDGELVGPDGAAVAWREYRAWRAGRSRGLLLKRLDSAAVEHQVAWPAGDAAAGP